MAWDFIKCLSFICASNTGKYILLRMSYCLEGYQVNVGQILFNDMYQDKGPVLFVLPGCIWNGWATAGVSCRLSAELVMALKTERIIVTTAFPDFVWSSALIHLLFKNSVNKALRESQLNISSPTHPTKSSRENVFE